MDPFTRARTVVTPLDRANVDTDQIVPKQFLKLVSKSGFGRYLFYDWRYDEKGNPRPGFVLNDARYRGSKILAAGENFGCGSSREHAVWALADYGFSVVVAPSFADIFYSNCFKNGILPIMLDRDAVSRLQSEPGEAEVDLEGQVIRTDSGQVHFEIDPHKKRILLEGLDDIAQTLRFEDRIAQFERQQQSGGLVNFGEQIT